jgi:pantetheine-phosphate adenylyltransferase
VRIAVYPGTFDPFTNAHLDIVHRSARIFDRVIVTVAKNLKKAPLFSLKERMGFIRQVLAGLSSVSVEAFDSLLVDFARARGASVIVRGLRAVSDFEYEFQMALMNRSLDEGIETVFLAPRQEYSYLSSTLVKEVAQYGGKVSSLVPPGVERALKRKFQSRG